VNARSDADLVVLSACEGAATQTILGGEVAGLAHMFLRSGAGAVLAGLWRVDDHATAFLMTAFYRAFLGGADAVDALKQAVELTSAQAPWKLPYYWSGFVLAQSRSRKLLPGMAHRRSSPDKGG
jgi:CHAT domain-containing protein